MATPRGNTYAVASGAGVYAGVASPQGATAGGRTLIAAAALLAGGASGTFGASAAGATITAAAALIAGSAGASGPPPLAPQGGARALTLQTATTGTSVPWTAGFAFRKGDIPAGQGVQADAGTLQVTPKNYWPDGSLKFAVLSGRVDLTAGTPRTITLSAGTSSTGTALTTADLPSGIRTTGISIACGAFGTATWTGADFDSPFGATAWVSGAIMSSWVYRKQVGTDAHLVAWLEVRLYAGGVVEVLPWIENGYLKVASPTNKSATYSFSLGGTIRNGGGSGSAIDLKHHQRTPLVSGSALSYWLGTDPGVTVKHDSAYLMSTELVPTYYATVSPSNGFVTGLPSTYTPLQAGSIVYDSDSMASSGYQAPIGLLMQSDVLHLTTTADTFASVVRNGYSAGRYGIHYRDENTNLPPRFQDRPNLVLADNQGFKDNGASTTSERTPAATGGNPPTWDIAHSPSVGYLAYLITGRFYFMEQVQFTATTNFIGNGDPTFLRDGVKGLVQTAVGAWQTRSCAWDWRSKIQALTVTPDSGLGSSIRQDLINCVEFNIAHFHARYVAQANNPWGFVLPGEGYDSSDLGNTLNDVAIWQQDFVTAAFGWSVSMDLPIGSTPKANLAAFFQWKAKSALLTLGMPGVSTEWPVHNPAPYVVRIGTGLNQTSFTAGTGPWQADTGAMLTATIASPLAPSWFSTNTNLVSFEFGPTADEACKGVFANRLPALAYAVRHGVAGARDAFYRLISAVNWPDIQTAFNSRPVWGVRPASGDLPAFMGSRAVGEWFEIPGTSGYGGAFVPWGQTVLRRLTSELMLVANGGHGDSFDNRVVSLKITADAPGAWTLRKAATPFGSVVADADYFADGAPNSRHSYNHHYMVEGTPLGPRAMMIGARGLYINGNDGKRVDGFAVGTGTTGGSWDAAGTWTDPNVILDGTGQDEVTGDVWTTGGRKWTAATGTWSTPAISGSGIAGRYPSAFRSKTREIFWLQHGNGQDFAAGLTASVLRLSGTPTCAAITFNASAAYTEWLAIRAGYAGMCYDAANDRFLWYPGTSGGSSNVPYSDPAKVFVVTPNSGNVWDMSILSVTGGTPPQTPGSASGINDRFKYIPSLRAVVMAARENQNLWCLRVAP